MFSYNKKYPLGRIFICMEEGGRDVGWRSAGRGGKERLGASPRDGGEHRVSPEAHPKSGCVRHWRRDFA